ncbi:alpha/beta fold hydrolase [Glycomyces arizonensis]|uniref:alpha/beta fold hydrolase n=1 Tax=Glycomyces arizonensis TaxID=256035 RepID=UPI00041ED53B|nr:alpha/beta fold hydrolase [Glycomyces arizonensis]
MSNNVRTRAAAGFAVAVLTGDAVMHLLWSFGLTWPASSERTLSYLVLGFETSFAPRVVIPLAVANLVMAFAVWRRAAGGYEQRFGRLFQAVTVAVAIGVGVRALAGLVWITGAGTPTDYPAFYWANLLVYTPLCVALALCCLAVARQGRGPARLRRRVALASPLAAAAAILLVAYGWTPSAVRGYEPADAGVDSRFVDTALAEFHYTLQGEGSPVVLLSPGASWAYAWQHQADVLAADHAVYVVDLPGQGFTELHEDDFAFNLDAMTGAVEVFLDAVGLDTVSLGGNSWSGGWALAFAQRHPDRVDRLVLLAPSGADEPDPRSWELLKPPVLGELMTKLYLPDRDAVAESVTELFVHKERATESVIEANWAPGTFADNLHSMYLLERGLDWSRTEAAMPETEQPTLVIWGERDTVLPVEQSATFAALMPDVHLEVLDDCGHALTLDCPDRVTERMADFLQ